MIELENIYVTVTPNRAFDENDLTMLIDSLWGIERRAELMPLLRRRASEFDCHVLMYSHFCIIGHAKIFQRYITAGNRVISTLALSAVFVLPAYRGLGHGRRLVREVFAQVDGRGFDVCMWQTAIPDFYIRLGARILRHPFANSPWQDPYTMIYPPTFDFGEGAINIQGETW